MVTVELRDEVVVVAVVDVVVVLVLPEELDPVVEPLADDEALADPPEIVNSLL